MPSTATRPEASSRASARTAVRPRLAGFWGALEGRRALDWAALLIGLCTAVLTVLGLVMVLSASSVEAISSSGGSYGLFLRQGGWALGGAVLLAVLRRLPVDLYRRLAWAAYLFAFLLLALVAFTPLGKEVNGNTNWLQLGPVTFQPSEAAKLAMALWAAAVLQRKERLVHLVSHALVPVLPFGVALILLVLKGRDLGTALILAFILAVILFVAGTPGRVFAVLAGIGVVAALGMTVFAANRMERVQAWLFGCEGLQGDPCMQPDHGIYALASGGWWGVGLGQSRQKWNYIPEAENDFIFTILGEELGLVGTLLVLACFVGLAVGMYRVAAGASSTFVRLATWGILAWIVGQAAMNIAMVTGLLPVVGVPLPFISYGGSALTLSRGAVGVVLSFARHERDLLPAAEASAADPASSASPQESR